MGCLGVSHGMSSFLRFSMWTCILLGSAAAGRAEIYIVMTEDAGIYGGDKLLRQLEPGSVVESLRTNGDWHLIPRLGGWVHNDKISALQPALDALDKQIKEKPVAVDLHFRGIVLSEMGRQGDAMISYDEAMKLGLSTPALFINRGNARQRAGDFEKAAAEFTEAIRLDEKSARAFNNRAFVEVELGFLDAALADVNQAIELDPKYAEALNNRGVIYRTRGDFRKAIEDYSTALEIAPWYANAYANRGYANKKLKDFEAAITDYKLALKVNPKFAGAMNDLAWLQATCTKDSVRDGESALKLATEACELTGEKNPECLDTLAAALAETGDFKKAVSTQLKAIKLTEAADLGPLKERLELYKKDKAFRDELK